MKELFREKKEHDPFGFATVARITFQDGIPTTTAHVGLTPGEGIAFTKDGDGIRERQHELLEIARDLQETNRLELLAYVNCTTGDLVLQQGPETVFLNEQTNRTFVGQLLSRNIVYFAAWGKNQEEVTQILSDHAKRIRSAN